MMGEGGTSDKLIGAMCRLRDGAEHILLLLLFLLPPVLTARFEFNPQFVMTLKQSGLLLVGALLFLCSLSENRASPRDVRIHWAVAGLMLVGGLSFLLSEHGRAGTEMLLLLLGFGMVYFGVYRVTAGRENPFSPSRALVLSLLLVSLYGLAQVVLDRPLLTMGGEEVHRAGPFMNRNLLASYLLVTVPFGIYLTVTSEHGWVRVLAAVASLTGMALLMLSGSEGAWLAGMGAILVVVAVYTVRRYGIDLLGTGGAWADAGAQKANETGGKPRLSAQTNVSLVILILVVVGTVGLIWKPGIPSRMARYLGVGSKSIKQRQASWEVAIKIFQNERPFGSGPGTFFRAAKKHQSDVLKKQPYRTLQLIPRHVHNDYLRYLAECGVAGYVAISVLIALALSLPLFRFLRAPPGNAWFALTVLSAFVTIFIHAWVHYPLSEPVTGGLFFGLLGYVNGAFGQRDPGSNGSQTIGLVLTKTCGVLLIVMVLVGQYRIFFSRVAFEHAEAARTNLNRTAGGGSVTDQLRQEVTNIEAHYKRAIRLDQSFYGARMNLWLFYKTNLYRRVFGAKTAERRAQNERKLLIAIMPYEELIYHRLGKEASKAYQSTKDDRKFEKAEQYFRKALDLNPNFLPSYREFAWLMQLEDPEKARNLYREATKIAPEDVSLYRKYIILHVRMLKKEGKVGQARRVLKKALRRFPEDNPLQIYVTGQLRKLKKPTGD